MLILINLNEKDLITEIAEKIRAFRRTAVGDTLVQNPGLIRKGLLDIVRYGALFGLIITDNRLVWEKMDIAHQTITAILFVRGNRCTPLGFAAGRAVAFFAVTFMFIMFAYILTTTEFTYIFYLIMLTQCGSTARATEDFGFPMFTKGPTSAFATTVFDFIMGTNLRPLTVTASLFHAIMLTVSCTTTRATGVFFHPVAA